MGRFLSQVDTQASASPMMKLLTEKKKKKKKKKTSEDQGAEQKSPTILEADGLYAKKKKKKKKTFEHDAENFDVVTQEKQNAPTAEEYFIETAPKLKKKKKNKTVASYNEELAAENVSCKHFKDDLADTLSSPLKKRALEEGNSPRKKKQKKNSKQALSEAEIDSKGFCEKVAYGDEVEDYIWSEEDELMILERMKDQLPEIDKKSCRVTLKEINWEAVAFKKRSAEACKNQFMRILSKINVIKSLRTVLEELKEFAMTQSKRRSRVVRPMHRFLKVYMDSNRKESMKANGEKYFSVAHEVWKNLPKEEKAIYQAEYEEDLRKLGLTTTSGFKRITRKAEKKKTPIALPRRPIEIWRLEEKDRTDDQYPIENKKENIKVIFSNVQKQEKMHYIELSLRELLQFEKEIEEFKTHNPDYECPKYRGPSKDELKFYLKEKGMPTCPPTKPYVLFYQEKLESGEMQETIGKRKLLVAVSMFKDLSYAERQTYRYLLNKKIAAYNKEMAAWEEEQDEITLYVRDKLLGKKRQHAGNTRDLIKSHNTRNKKMSSPRKVQKKNSERFSNVVCLDMSCPKFHDVPLKPPRTPFRLFCLKLEHSSQKLFESNTQKNKVFRENWEKLTNEQKLAYSKRCSELQKNYEKQLLEYVRGMSKKIRKVYLGFHRKTMFQYFHHDIFEEDYPNEKYPVYVLTPRKTKTMGINDEEFVDNLAFSSASSHDKNRKIPENVDSVSEENCPGSLLSDDELFKFNKDGCISESKSSKNVTTKAYLSVSNDSRANDGEMVTDSVKGEETRLDKKQHNISDEESSRSSDEEYEKSPHKSLKGMMRTVQGSSLKKGKPSSLGPNRLETDDSSGGETDMEVCPAWQTQVHFSSIKPEDDSSSGLLDSD